MQPAETAPHSAELSDELLTGLEELDAQHRYYLKLLDAVRLLNKNSAPELVRGFVLEVVRYAQCHFAYEETMMTVYEYPNRTQHIAEHAAILASIKRSAETQEINFAQARLQLVRWLYTHIPLDDKPLAEFVMAQRPAIIRTMNLSAKLA